MVNKLLQFYEGIRYYLFSKHKRGYGIHSPFIYDLVRNVLMKASRNRCFANVKVEFEKFAESYTYEPSQKEFGAGSKNVKSLINLQKLAGTSGLKVKYINLICEMISHYKVRNFLELGTCCGITSASVAKNMQKGKVVTIEGNRDRATVANKFFQHLKLENIELQTGDFSEILPAIASSNIKFDMAFIDGDHTYEATIRNFEKVAGIMSHEGIIILDDIYWSKEMTAAWREIQQSEQSVISVDLYRLGIVFLGRRQVKQSFIIRF